MRVIGSLPATVALPPEPGLGTWWIRPVLRSLTRALPSGSTATDQAMSSPPSRVTGPAGWAAGGRVVVGVADVEVLLPASVVVVRVVDPLVPGPVEGAEGSAVEHAAVTSATTTPPTRARPTDREECGIPHCVPPGARDRGGSAAASPERIQQPVADVGVDHVRDDDPSSRRRGRR